MGSSLLSREVRARAQTETWSRGCGGVLLSGLLSLVSYTPQNHLPRSELGPPTPIIDQENAPHRCSQANLIAWVCFPALGLQVHGVLDFLHGC